MNEMVQTWNSRGGSVRVLPGRGLVKAAPIITHRLPLADFGKAVEISRQRTDSAIKVLLQP